MSNLKNKQREYWEGFENFAFTKNSHDLKRPTHKENYGDDPRYYYEIPMNSFMKISLTIKQRGVPTIGASLYFLRNLEYFDSVQPQIKNRIETLIQQTLIGTPLNIKWCGDKKDKHRELLISIEEDFLEESKRNEFYSWHLLAANLLDTISKTHFQI